jgi:hypothetical protein
MRNYAFEHAINFFTVTRLLSSPHPTSFLHRINHPRRAIDIHRQATITSVLPLDYEHGFLVPLFRVPRTQPIPLSLAQ